MKSILCSTVIVVAVIGEAAFCDEIHDAAGAGDLDKVRILLLNDTNLLLSAEGLGRTPLHYAAAFGRRDVAELLLTNGAPVDQTDYAKNTPLHFAELYGQEEVVRLLLKYNANDKALNCSGLTPVDMRKLHAKYDGPESTSIGATNDLNNYYSEYKEDFKLCHGFNRIGNVGAIKAVIDLRGFIPLVGLMPDTKSEYSEDRDTSMWRYGSTCCDFYEVGSHFIKVPTKTAIGVIYYGQGTFGSIPNNGDCKWQYQVSMTPMSKMDNVDIIQEKDLSGEYKQWANAAYDISNQGEALFLSLGGDSGFQSAEPVAILFTDDSSFVLINFRYSHWILGDGEYLVALEFSRHLHRFKAVYDIFDTFTFRPSTRTAIDKTGSLIMKSLILFNGGQ